MSENVIQVKKEILIVEHDALAAADLANILNEQGYSVYGTVTSVEGALNLVEENQPDLVMVDITLSGELDGVAAAKVLWKKYGIPVVFITANADIDRLEQATLTYPFGFILKPFQGRELRAAVKMALRIAQYHTEQKRNEQSLRVAEGQLRTLGDNLPNGVIYRIVNMPDGHVFFDYISAGFLSIFELSEDSVKQDITPLYDLLHPDDRDAALEAQSRCAENLQPFRYECRFVLPSGTTRWIRWHSSPELKADGMLIWNGMALDITDRKQAEQAIFENQQRFLLAFETAYIGVCLVDLEGRLIKVNSQMSKMFGYSKEELERMTVKDFSSPDEKSIGPNFMEEAKSGNIDNVEFERRYITKNGDLVWCRVSISLVRGEDGEPLYFVTHIQNITEQKMVDEALAKAKQDWIEIFQAIGHPILILDPQHRILDANRAAISSIGMHLKNLRGRNCYETTGCVTGTPHNCPLLKTQQTRQKEEEVVELKATGKTYIISCTPVFDSEKNIEKIIHISTDITERTEAEKKLRAAEELYRTLFEEAPVMYVITRNENGIPIISNCNKAFVDSIGYSRDKIIGQPLSDFYTSESKQQMIENGGYQRALNNEIFNEERELLCADGRIIKTLLNAVPVHNQIGQATGTRALYLDVTRRKQVEKALKESEEKFRRLFEAESHAIILIDRETGEIIEANPAAMHLFGYGRIELLTMKLTDISAELQMAVRDIGKENILFNIQIYRKRDRITFPAEIRTSYFTYGSKEIQIITINDLSKWKKQEEERRKLEAQFRQAQKMESIGRLAGGVAHDFNNMLSVIIGNAELVQLKMKPDEPHYKNLGEIVKAGRKSADLTRQLLAFARKQVIQPIVLDLNDSIESMLKLLRRLLGEDIDILWKPSPDLWLVKMDPAQLDQIMVNLCVNARDAIFEHGTVIIETQNIVIDNVYCQNHEGSRLGQFVGIAVSDNGAGIDQETLMKIFEPFFTTKKDGKGTGLGLSMIYGIVKQNDGFINAYSELGQGTTFKIYIPRHSGKISKPNIYMLPEAIKGRGETILLVEDELNILKIGTLILEKLGYNVLASNLTKDALEIARDYKGEITLLLTDVIMPGLNGRELARLIREIRPDIKCLFMSGYTADVIVHHGVLDEGVHFLEKPLTLSSVAQKVREVLDS